MTTRNNRRNAPKLSIVGSAGYADFQASLAAAEAKMEREAFQALWSDDLYAPAPHITGKAKRLQRASNGAGSHRGSYGHGKRADIKRDIADRIFHGNLPRDLGTFDESLALAHDSSVASVRSIRSDFFASLSAWRDDLAPKWQKVVRSAKPGSWIADFNQMVRDDPITAALPAQAIVGHFAAMLAALGHSGFCLSKESIGASAKACLESLAIVTEYSGFKSQDRDPAQMELLPADASGYFIAA